MTAVGKLGFDALKVKVQATVLAGCVTAADKKMVDRSVIMLIEQFDTDDAYKNLAVYGLDQTYMISSHDIFQTYCNHSSVTFGSSQSNPC